MSSLKVTCANRDSNKDDRYPVIFPILSHTFVTYSPHPHIIDVRALIAVIDLVSLRGAGTREHSAVSDAAAAARLILGLVLETLLICIRRVHFSGPVLLRSVIPTIRSVIRMPVPRLGLDVIVISVTEIPPLYHFARTFVSIALVSVIIGIHRDARVTGWLSKRYTSVVLVRFLMRFSIVSVVLILILELLLIALKSRRSVLLRRVSAGAVVVGISGITSLAAFAVFLRMPRRRIVSATAFLIPAEPPRVDIRRKKIS